MKRIEWDCRGRVTLFANPHILVLFHLRPFLFSLFELKLTFSHKNTLFT